MAIHRKLPGIGVGETRILLFAAEHGRVAPSIHGGQREYDKELITKLVGRGLLVHGSGSSYNITEAGRTKAAEEATELRI